MVVCLLALSSKLFPENSSIFFVKRFAFLYGSCLAVRRRQLVGGMCSMLPYDSGICCYAFIFLKIIVFVFDVCVCFVLCKFVSGLILCFFREFVVR